jgi:bifunctional UDP-N-acetylglucosamine pyrophosphorylase/glucosamine-1-phosphate N-acetyltransferase
MTSLATAILAAGLGTRMKSDKAKVLHPIAGRPMIDYPVALAKALGSQRTVCVLGYQADAVRAALDKRFGEGAVEVALQLEQKGTGHALQQTESLLGGHDGLMLILYGDTPLLTQPMLQSLIERASATTFALVTFRPADPKGYGRIVRQGDGRFDRIVEEKDCNHEQRCIGEVNAGIYCGPARFFFDALKTIVTNNAQGELYLTDVAERAARVLNVVTIEAPADEVLGCNDRVDLARADRLMRLRLAEGLMRSGVTVRDPERIYVEPGVAVGRDTVLGPGVELRGQVRIGAGCTVDQGVVISDCVIGDRVHIKPYCVLTESTVGDDAQIGPWAHLRPGSQLEPEVHLGNFVETKKTRLGRGAKANHLSYLGDADVGAKVNVGCGTITCNYDGYAKYRTVIEEGAFIGSDTQLVAPVTVGAGAVTGAGTTVYADVPPGALVLTRPELVIVEGWAERKRQKMTAKRNGVSAEATAAAENALAAEARKKSTTRRKSTVKKKTAAKKKTAQKRPRRPRS